MRGWKFRWHRQRLFGWSVGLNIGKGRGAGWVSFYVIGTLGHQYISIHVSKRGV